MISIKSFIADVEREKRHSLITYDNLIKYCANKDKQEELKETSELRDYEERKFNERIDNLTRLDAIAEAHKVIESNMGHLDDNVYKAFGKYVYNLFEIPDFRKVTEADAKEMKEALNQTLDIED